VSLILAAGSDSIGDSTISGDLRWGGSLGVNVDFVARSHCSAEFIRLEDMHVFAPNQLCETKFCYFLFDDRFSYFKSLHGSDCHNKLTPKILH
jgi:hypothetical protein